MTSMEHFTTSDVVFVVNTKLTPNLWLLFSVLVTTMNVLRTPIDCYADLAKDDRKANFCWSVGTFTCTNQTTGK